MPIISTWAVCLFSELHISVKKDISCVSCIVFIVFHSAIPQTWNNIMGHILSATSDAGSLPKKQKKIMTLQEKVELFDMWHRLKSAVACHFKINESRVKDHCKKRKENLWSHHCSCTLHFLQNIFLCCTENAVFMWVQDCYKEDIPINSNMIQEEVKSLYDILK